MSKNKKAYRNLNNTLLFRALEDNHPFKLQVFQAFKTKKRYTSTEIAERLITIVKDQVFKTMPMQTASQSRLMNLFQSCVDATYTGGKYLVKGYEPKHSGIKMPEPIKRIPKEEYAANYFEINNQATGKPQRSTNTIIILQK